MVEMEIKEKKFVMLTNDLLFKETFGNPRNMKHLEDLLESYYGYPSGFLKGRVKCTYEVTLPKSRLNDKSIRGDLIAIIDNNIIVNIEMYSVFNEYSYEKSEYYVMRIHSTQLNISDNYNDIKKVTQINFVDEVNLEIEENIKQTLNNNKYSKVEMNIVRLDLARKMKYTNDDRFIKYLKFLGARTLEERTSIAEGDELLMDLNDWLEKYTNDETLNEDFNDWEWNQKIYYHQGKISEKQETAKNLIAMDMSTENISKATGLSLEEIEKLKEEN